MPDEPIAVVLCRATNKWPIVTSDYNVFIDELLADFDGLNEVQYNQVPEDARKWAMNAIDNINNGNPVEQCPGFENVFDVKDRTPMFKEDPNEPEKETETVDKAGKKVRKPRVSRGANKIGKAKGGAREARPLGDGKITKILDAIYAEPKASVENIIATLATQGVEVKAPTVANERSNYRRVVKHLTAKGVMSKQIEF